MVACTSAASSRRRRGPPIDESSEGRRSGKTMAQIDVSGRCSDGSGANIAKAPRGGAGRDLAWNLGASRDRRALDFTSRARTLNPDGASGWKYFGAGSQGEAGGAGE